MPYKFKTAHFCSIGSFRCQCQAKQVARMEGFLIDSNMLHDSLLSLLQRIMAKTLQEHFYLFKTPFYYDFDSVLCVNITDGTDGGNHKLKEMSAAILSKRSLNTGSKDEFLKTQDKTISGCQ